MFLFSIMITKLLLMNADGNLNSQYCNKRESSCNKTTSLNSFPEERFLLYDVDPSEGFNLRREVYMRFAILITEAQKNNQINNWRLVLPPWYKVHHWSTQSLNQPIRHEPIPWNAFFDIKSLKTFAPVIEMFEAFTELPSSNNELVIDVLFVMQKIKGDYKHKSGHWKVNDDRVTKGNDTEQSSKKGNLGCNYNGDFWGYKNVSVREIICINTTGQIKMLWDVLNLRPWSKTVMIANSQVLAHETLHSSIEVQKSFWECRKSMKFSQDLEAAADTYLRMYLDCHNRGCATYIAVHWRGTDFRQKRVIPSVNTTVAQIHQFITSKCPNIKKIFIASAATEDDLGLLELELLQFGYKVYQNSSSKYVVAEHNDGGISIVDQIICSRAAYFIGTQDSTFTFRIQEERDILGFASKTTYNRLCLDRENCTKVMSAGPVVTEVTDQYERVCTV